MARLSVDACYKLFKSYAVQAVIVVASVRVIEKK